MCSYWSVWSYPTGWYCVPDYTVLGDTNCGASRNPTRRLGLKGVHRQSGWLVTSDRAWTNQKFHLIKRPTFQGAYDILAVAVTSTHHKRGLNHANPLAAIRYPMSKIVANPKAAELLSSWDVGDTELLSRGGRIFPDRGFYAAQLFKVPGSRYHWVPFFQAQWGMS